MRKSKLLDSIIPVGRQRILAAVILPPDREWYVSDLAAKLRVPPSSLQRDLARLATAGVLTRRRDGNRVYFRANAASPIMPELRRLLIKTSGLVDVLHDVLQPVASSVRCAFVHGSVARSEETSDSDVDLVIIGDVGLADLVMPIRAASEQLGREINPSMYRPDEFAKKAASGHHFISKVLEREKLFVVGSQDELDAVIGR